MRAQVNCLQIARMGKLLYTIPRYTIVSVWCLVWMLLVGCWVLGVGCWVLGVASLCVVNDV